MIGLAADHDTERNKSAESPAPRGERDCPRQLERARNGQSLMLVARRLDRAARALEKHVIEARIETRFDQKDRGHRLFFNLDGALFNDGQSIAGEANRRVARVREQDHVVDPKRGKNLRAGAVATHRIAHLRRLA